MTTDMDIPTAPAAKELTTSPGRSRRAADRRRVSAMLQDLAESHTEPRLSLWQLRDAFGHRAHGALLFVFALINFIPVPPGAGFVLAFPVLMVAAQMVWGVSRPFLPRWLGKRSFRTEDFKAAVKRIVPIVVRVERLLRPRAVWLAEGLGERLVGVLCLALAVVLFMPVPLGNWPPALAICILSLALLERDGLAILFGVVVAGASFTIAWAALEAAAKATVFFINHLFV